MARLAKLHLHVSAQVHRNLRDQLPQVLHHSFQRNPVLIPYDTDANHEPCLRNGKKAHWAIVTGFCALTSKQKLDFLPKQVSGDSSEILPVIDLELFRNEIKGKHLFTDIFKDSPLENFFLICKQGKSCLYKLFDAEMMCQSNNNLYEIEDKRRHELEYMLPEGGLHAQLNDRFLVIRNNL